MAAELPTEIYVEFLGGTIDVHWDYHAWLMFGVWFGLVPVALLAVRFGKPPPTEFGIPRATPAFSRKLLWWAIHRGGLYAAIALALAGGIVAVAASGGFSGSIHAVFGLGAILLGCLQIVSAWIRGSHGGRNSAHADPDDASTWRGDHFDMTPRRRWFEAYHKTAGYFAIVLALAAVATGLAQFWLSGIAVALAIVVVSALLLAVLLENAGIRHDTYHSVYGTHPDHPYNRVAAGSDRAEEDRAGEQG